MNKFSSSFLEDLKNHSQDIAERLLQHSPDGKFLCPFCGNGKGDKGTGVDIDKPGNHCFSCGRSFTIFQAVQKVYNENFPAAVKHCAEVLNMDLKYEGDSNNTNSSKKPIATSDKPKPKPADNVIKKLQKSQNNLTEYYNKCAKELPKSTKAVNYLKHRGLFVEDLINRFNIGYDADINCIVIPHTDYYCTRRAITDDKKLRFIHNLKGVSVELFNSACLASADVVFIVEGAMDALSIILAGAEAIAIGGASNVKLLAKALEDNDENNPAIAILTDDDRAGNKSAGAIINELKGLDVYFERVKLPDKLDANEWLCKDSKRLEDFIAKTSNLLYVNPHPTKSRVLPSF